MGAVSGGTAEESLRAQRVAMDVRIVMYCNSYVSYAPLLYRSR